MLKNAKHFKIYIYLSRENAIKILTPRQKVNGTALTFKLFTRAGSKLILLKT